MRLIKRGASGADVEELVADLVALGYLAAGTRSTTADAEVLKAVRRFQSRSLGPDGMPLVVDGAVGPLTRFALDVALKRRRPGPIVSLEPPTSAARRGDGSGPGWNALRIAKAELAKGAGEAGGDNKGPDVMRYHAITGGSAGDSWCASFVAFCFDQGNPGAMPYEPTYGARETLTRFKKKGWSYRASFDQPPAPGDIIVWWREATTSWKGHIGLVSAYSDGIVYTIEGNRGDYPSKVSSFHYKLGKIEQLLGFGRVGGV